MPRTDTSEEGLESLIYEAMTGYREPPASRDDLLKEAPEKRSGTGWLPGDPYDYDREYAVDLEQLAGFLEVTQTEAARPRPRPRQPHPPQIPRPPPG